MLSCKFAIGPRRDHLVSRGHVSESIYRLPVKKWLCDNVVASTNESLWDRCVVCNMKFLFLLLRDSSKFADERLTPPGTAK